MMLVFRTRNALCFPLTLWVLAWGWGVHVVVRASSDCASDVRPFHQRRHKQKYTIAIHATEGFDVALSTYDTTFSEYLTATAGRRFDPPLEFELVPMKFGEIMSGIDEDKVDFIFSNPSTYTCVGVEKGAQPVATIIQKLSIHDNVYELDTFAGVMLTLASNEDIQVVEDFKDKVIGAVGISVLNAGQSQFYEMSLEGMSFVMDPKKVVFTGNQVDVVEGVITGEFDVGFVRTSQIERHEELTGRSIDKNMFKILHPKVHVQDDDTIFPFLHSTEMYPEYLLSALDTTATDVVTEVQDALLALRAHAEAGEVLGDCNASIANCDIQNVATRCDTTFEIAQIAMSASRLGHLFGFRSPKSYFHVRSMLQSVGFMTLDKKGNWQCTKDKTLFENLPCPADHYKLSREDFDSSCIQKGLECKDGYLCYCKPCVKAHEVEIYEHSPDSDDVTLTSVGEKRGCDKMDLCGTVEQTKTITMQIFDNLKRADASVTATLFAGDEQVNIAVEHVEDQPYTYHLSWSGVSVGIVLLQVNFDSEAIAESPLRLEVVERNCAAEFPSSGLTAAVNGECECSGDSVALFRRCIDKANITTASCIVSLVAILVAGFYLLRYRTRQIDALWKIEIDELTFEDPPVVIGQGSFGIVIRAEYRGIYVAIKRAVKPKRANRYGSITYGQSAVPQLEDDAGKHEYPELDGDEENARGMSISMMKSKSGTSGGQLGFLREFRTRKQGLVSFWGSGDITGSHLKATMLGESVSQTTEINLVERMFPCVDPRRKRVENFMREMRVLSRLRHPCITTVFGAVVVNPRDPMLVMEYLEYGSLAEGLLQNETIYLTGEIIVQIARDVVQGLRYLHSTNPPILHGDLKAKNILVDARFRAKLCDFGLSTKKKKSISGTPYWLPPEYLVGDSNYTTYCDIYSFGVVLYEMYARKSPYEGEEFVRVLKDICNPRIKKRPKIAPTTPSRMSDLMKKCWNVNPFNRPNARDLDTIMMDMQAGDAEPLKGQEEGNHRTKVRTGDMLYEIFPKHIADTLKAGKKPDAEHHDLCTIVFSDIVGFTTISREISPLKVSEMLDRLYLAFDEIACKHSVFKVETIGDAYMGVTNLQGDQNHNHVKLAAEFAVDMIKEASKILIDEENPSRGFINIRVGFHSGPVVSNVIGTLNPRYGLFGDTVNTANRMESNSKANRILCSEYSYNLLTQQAPQMRVRRRGKIDVKGRGEMKVFWVGGQVEEDISFSHSGFSGTGEGANRRVAFLHDDDRSIDSIPIPEQDPRSILRPPSPAKKAAQLIGNLLRPGSPFRSTSPGSKALNEVIGHRGLNEPNHRTLSPLRSALKITDHNTGKASAEDGPNGEEQSVGLRQNPEDFSPTASENENAVEILDDTYNSSPDMPFSIVTKSANDTVKHDSTTDSQSSNSSDLELELYDAVTVVHKEERLEAVVTYFAPNGAIGVCLTGSSAGKGESLKEFHCPPKCGLLCARSSVSKRSLTRLEELSLRRDLAELTLRRELNRQQNSGQELEVGGV